MIGEGGSPARTILWRVRSMSGLGTGMALTEGLGVGVARPVDHVEAGPSSTILPRYMTATLSEM